jgi:acetyl-CoA decarbonylase/synthase complex subunit delta
MAEELKMVTTWSQAVSEMRLGAGRQEGGSRKVTLTVGGEETLPFLFKEGALPHAPLVAAEIFDIPPDDDPETLRCDLKGISKDPATWAKAMVEEAGADLVCIKLAGIHPDGVHASADHAVGLVKKILCVVDRPLIVLGCGEAGRDNEVLPLVSEATRGERLLFGDAVQENYKTLTAACIADGHNIIAESPIDVNIAKQLNILISDLGMPLDRIIINPTIGALGYGLEYA